MLKRFVPTIVISLILLFFSPGFVAVIFLSGDSCCGENTSGTMFLVSFLIIGLNLFGSFVMNLIYKYGFKNSSEGYSVALGSILAVLPAAVIYLLFATTISLTAFN